MKVLGDWLLTAQRAAIHVPTSTAVLADLHLGYDQVRRRAGEAVPIAGVEKVLATIQEIADGHLVRSLVIAGDLVEGTGAEDAAVELAAGLRELGVELTAIVPGNHDRALLRLDKPGLPLHLDGIRLGRWHVVHGDGKPPRGPIVQGHVHPCLRLRTGLSAPCYLVGPNWLVLPAFSADAAGVNVLSQPCWRRHACCAIAGDEVLNFGNLAELQKALQMQKSEARSQKPRARNRRRQKLEEEGQPSNL